MVGVAGRSKACITCRARKKGCDLARPTCGQCRKACIACGGYSREHKFVSTTLQNLGSTTVVLPASLARSVYQVKYLELFWGVHLPRGWTTPSQVARLTLGGGWFDTVQRLCLSDPVLKKAALAMSLSTLGRRENSRHMQEEGLRLYVNSLRESAIALAAPQWRDREDALLAAARLFSLHEAMYGSDDADVPAQTRSWLAHNRGDLAILAARSPESYATGHAHRLFSDGRMHLVTMALRSRKKVFLSDTPWKTLPWSQHDKTPRDHLIDILIDIPTLFEGLDNMLASNDLIQREQLRRRVWNGYLQLDRLLVDWHEKCAPTEDMSPWHLDGTKIPQTITPGDLVAAHLITLYWTTCIILYGLVRDVLLSSRTDSPRLLSPCDNESTDKDPSTACRKLIKTLPIFFHPDAGTFRVHLATFPMSVAVIHLTLAVKPEDMLEERGIFEWCLQKPECLTIRKFIASMRPEKNVGEFTATAIQQNAAAPRH